MTDKKNDIESKALALFEQALGQARETRRDFIEQAAAGDEILKARLITLLNLDSQNASQILTGQAVYEGEDLDLSNSNIGSYRIKELIGKGGMGAVYKAERSTGDFSHEVAIKLIRPGVLSTPLVERFARERQTLANFSHPYIARLFDGGTTDDGTPYIIMEFVDGASITEWVNLRDKSTAERLTLFKHACEAIRYAHQNLIVHRDITPNNVLVTKHGDVKLIDFGIAKSVEGHGAFNTSDNSLNSLSFTPGFAAPERSKGAPANTLSDIYSLGRLLSVLIKPADQAQDIKAIINKAAAFNPADRYASVDALIDDLEKYKEGFPVTAAHQSPAYQLKKFINRHKSGIAFGLTSMIGLLVAFGVTLVQYDRAETALIEANKRFGEVRTLSKTLMFDIYDEVADIPGSVKPRALLANVSAEYLNSLASDPKAPPAVQLEAGEGYLRLASITGQHGSTSLGNITDSKQYFEKSRDILHTLHTDFPDMENATIALGGVYSSMALQSLRSDGDSKAARHLSESAIDVLSTLNSQTSKSATSLARAYLYRGDSYGWDNDIPQAGVIYEEGIQLVNEMPNAIKNTNSVQRVLSGLVRQSGEVYRYTGDSKKALSQLKHAVEIARTVDSGSSEGIFFLTEALWSLGDMYREDGQLDAALMTLNEALDIVQREVKENPNDASLFSTTALITTVLSQTYSARSDHIPALETGKRTIEIKREILERSGNDKGRFLYLAVGLKDIAPVYHAAGRKTQACEMWSEAAGIFEQRRKAETLSDYDIKNNFQPVIDAMKSCPPKEP